MNAIEEQHIKIIFVAWVQDPAFLNGIPNESKNFWVRVLQNASFTELATYALDCLTTAPISNAVVKRIFSMVSSIKTKPRNRMEFIYCLLLLSELGLNCCYKRSAAKIFFHQIV